MLLFPRDPKAPDICYFPLPLPPPSFPFHQRPYGGLKQCLRELLFPPSANRKQLLDILLSFRILWECCPSGQILPNHKYHRHHIPHHISPMLLYMPAAAISYLCHPLQAFPPQGKLASNERNPPADTTQKTASSFCFSFCHFLSLVFNI